MRRWIIITSLTTNVLLAGLILLTLWLQAGWGNPVRLSSTETRVLVVIAVAAVGLNLLLVPVLGISFWARDRGTRRLERQVATLEHHPPAPGMPARTTEMDEVLSV
jgi:hypothetical protein